MFPKTGQDIKMTTVPPSPLCLPDLLLQPVEEEEKQGL